MRLLLDEMYPPALADTLTDHGVEAVTVRDLGLAGRADLDVLEAAASDGRVLLTENVADFAALAADWLLAGRHHPGILIALSSRFSRRPGHRAAIAEAVAAILGEDVTDRVVYLDAPA